MASNPGDGTHPPGPDRVANVRECMGETNYVSQGAGGGGHVKSEPVLRDPTPPNFDSKTLCPSLEKMVDASSGNFDDISGRHRTPHSVFTTMKLPLAIHCHISNGVAPSYTCSFARNFYRTLVDKTTACFPQAGVNPGDDMTTFTIDPNGAKSRFTIYKVEDQTTLMMFAH